MVPSRVRFTERCDATGRDGMGVPESRGPRSALHCTACNGLGCIERIALTRIIAAIERSHIDIIHFNYNRV